MTFASLRADLSSANNSLANAKAEILQKKATIQWLATRIAEEKALGNDASSLETSKGVVEAQLVQDEANLTGPSGPIADAQGHVNTYSGYTATQKKETVEECGDQYPILMFPVRLEVHFEDTGSGHELWVRFYPGEAGINNHELPLTRSEFNAAKAYKEAVAAAATQAEKLARWDYLVQEFGRERAAYLVHSGDSLSADYDSYTLRKPGGWNEPARARTLPDFFVVSCYSTYDIEFPPTTADVEKVSEKVIPDALDIGLDPNQDPSKHPEETDGLKWLYDFDEAVANGMGMKIPISATQYNNGFDRVVAIGVKTHLNESQTATRVEELFKNHHYAQGMSFLQTGEDTKNTESGRSAYGSTDPGNENTYAVECQGALFTTTSSAIDKPNGQWLADALGIGHQVFENIAHSDGKDITNAMRMNEALYPATLERTLRSWFGDTITMNDLNETHEFFTQYARSRGALPSIRIDKQPYGVLPATSYANFTMHVSTPNPTYHNSLKGVLDGVEGKWRGAVKGQLEPGTSDPLQVFADVAGRSATSQRFFKRTGAGPEYTWNNLVFYDKAGEATTWETSRQNLKTDINNELGINLDTNAPILGATFHSAAGQLTMPVVEDLPASKTRTLQPIGSSSTNYITWLKDATVKELIDEDFTGIGATTQDKPNSLLYLYLRQSMLLLYHDTACNLLGKPQSERKDFELLNFSNPALPTEGGPAAGDLLSTPGSRLSIFDEEYPVGSGQAMGAYLDSADLSVMTEGERLYQCKEHLDILEELTTSELELLTTETLDVVTNRFDAWRVGLVSQKLIAMRESQATGLFIGGYGWLEDVRSASKTADSTDWSGDENFGDLNGETVWQNDDNKGYVLAPSLQHATTAALLRSGYDSEADSSDPRSHEINLSSQRVRKVTELFNGLRNGQKLGALLGYEIERGLNDTDAVLNQYIYTLRNAFPFHSITEDSGEAQELVKARNVVDGTKLLEAYRAAERSMTDFDDDNNIGIQSGHSASMKAVIDYTESLLDAVSDMAIAEGAFEMVKGNMQNANAAIASMSGGKNLPESTIKKTPRTGKGIVNKVMLRIPEETTGVATGWSASPSQLSSLEPSLNAWAGSVLGNGTDLGCTVSIKHKSVLPDPIESCYKLQGDGYAEILQLDEDAPEGGLYLSLRIKLIPGNDQKDATILSLGDMKLTQGSASDNSIRLVYENGGTQTVNTGIVLTTKTWTKLDLRITTDSLKIWVDDNTTEAHEEASFAMVVPAIDYKVYLGSNTDGSGGLGYFYIADIECHDIGAESLKRNRIAHYRCSEGSGTEVKDRTFNQNHGTLSSASLHSFEEKFIVSLKDLEIQPYDLVARYDGALSDDDSSISSAIKALVKSQRLLSHDVQVNIDYTSIDAAAESLINGSTPSSPLADQEVLLKYLKRVLANSTAVKSTDFLASGEQSLSDVDQYDYANFKSRIETYKNAFDLALSGDQNASPSPIEGLKDMVAESKTYTSSSLAHFKSILKDLLSLGVKEAIHEYEIEDNEAAFNELKVAFAPLYKQLSKKQTAVAAQWSTLADGNDVEKARSVRILQNLSKELTGNGVLVLPKILLLARTKASIKDQYAGQYPSTLLRDSDNDAPASEASLLALDEWVQGLARVRPKIGDFELFTALSDANGNGADFDSFVLKPFQFPYNNNKWMALPVKDEADMVGGCCCIALSGWNTPHTECDSSFAALLIDEWNEVLPNREELGGVSFHYDQPNAKAPQSLLLAVPPSNRGYWKFDDLIKTVNETFDLAKMRAVEYSELATTKVAHLLPLLLTPVTEGSTPSDINSNSTNFS